MRSPTSPATSTLEGTGTRERILAHAVQLASAEGLESLTIGRLATDLGMSKSGLFGHFGSKEELQLATIEAGSKIFQKSVILPALDKPEGKQRLAALVNGFIDYLERSVFDGGCFWGSVSAEFDSRPGPVRDSVEEKVGHWVNVMLEQAKATGTADPKQLTFELHAISQGANSEYQLFRDPEVFARARKTIERLLQ